jgi:rhodanese-related sulfurtransferase
MHHRTARARPPVLPILLLVAATLFAGCSATLAPARPTLAPATIVAPTQPRSTPTAAPAAALPDTVTVAAAAALRDGGAFVLDVRQPEEWAEVHIPGATLIPLGELAGRLAEVPRDRDVLVVCRSGNRSQEGRDILRAAGYGRVTSMDGGVSEWQASGLPTASGS